MSQGSEKPVVSYWYVDDERLPRHVRNQIDLGALESRLNQSGVLTADDAPWVVSRFLRDEAKVPSTPSERVNWPAILTGIGALGFLQLGAIVAKVTMLGVVALVLVGIPAIAYGIKKACATAESHRNALLQSDAMRTITASLVRLDLTAWAGTGTPEGELASRGLTAAAQIGSSEAWRSRHLDDHRIRLDLHEQVRQLIVRCRQIGNVRSELVEAKASPHGLKLAEEAEGVLDSAVVSLRGRVEAIESYRDHVKELDHELAALEHVGTAEAVQDQLTDIIAKTANDAREIEHLQGMSDEVAAAADAVRDILTLIKSDHVAIEKA